ncbi:sel1 repeat family protein [Sulfurivermis fontis]|uniref:sel1 repeat family protein n=1 Tax=Sulfurivermis fontis TaxID=1972068 RepID=UPI000FD7690B|nr:sel1 repeat family protein [Sulfurivermis fontis]
MRHRFTAALFCLFCSTFARAGFEEGMAAYEQGNYTAAYAEFLQAARQGDMRAQGKLGGLYLYGVGVEKNYIEAYAWLDLAAGQGDTSAEKFRDAIADQLTIKQMREAAVLAEDYYDKYVAPFRK